MRLLSEQERGDLLPAELIAFDSPIPTQIVSSDEFVPTPQTARQREVEVRFADAGRRACPPAGDKPSAVPAHRRRYGGGVPRDERGLRACVWRQSCRSRGAGLGRRARRSAFGTVHFRRAYPFPARGHAAPGFRAHARGGGQSPLESGAGGQAPNHRRPQVRQLSQRDFLRQRYEDRVDQQRAFRYRERLVPHESDDGAGPCQR